MRGRSPFTLHHSPVTIRRSPSCQTPHPHRPAHAAGSSPLALRAAGQHRVRRGEGDPRLRAHCFESRYSGDASTSRRSDSRRSANASSRDRNYDYLTGVFGTRVRSATLQLGDERIELEQYLTPAGQPIPVDSRSNDLWFQHFAVVVSDMERAYEHVRQFAVQSISSAPQTIPESNKAAAGIKAYKFKDPDGHPLELLWFPADKGRPKWQQPGGRLFLGIDHSAIGISSTERSTAFYRDLIGLAVAGGGCQYRHDSGAARQRVRRGRAHHRAAPRTGCEPGAGVPAIRDAVGRTSVTAEPAAQRPGSHAHRDRGGRPGSARPRGCRAAA